MVFPCALAAVLPKTDAFTRGAAVASILGADDDDDDDAATGTDAADAPDDRGSAASSPRDRTRVKVAAGGSRLFGFAVKVRTHMALQSSSR